jgi:hypothetical protein
MHGRYVHESPQRLARVLRLLPSASCVVLPFATPGLVHAVATSCPRISRIEIGCNGEMSIVALGLGANGPLALTSVDDAIADALTHYCPRLRAIALRAPSASASYSGVSPAAFEALLRGLPDLRNLEISGCLQVATFPAPWTDEQRQQAELAAALEGEPDAPAPPPPPLELALTTVTLARVWVTHEDLTNLLATARKLVALRCDDLTRGSFQFFSLDENTSPPFLRSIALSHVRDLLTVVVHDAPSVVDLTLSGCNALRELTCECSGVSRLSVEGCFALISVSVASLALGQLDLTDCISLVRLSADCPELTTLSLRGCRGLRGVGLSALAGLRSLPMLVSALLRCALIAIST